MEETMSSDDNFLKVLQEAAYSHKIQIGVDFWKVNRPGSPFYSYFDNIVSLIFSVLIGYWWYANYNLAFAVISFVVAFLVSGRIIIKRATGRARNAALSDSYIWWEMWTAGALSIRSSNGNQCCFSPRDSWRDFARSLLGEGS